MRLAFEAFRVDLVDALGARGTRREPPARGDDLEAVDRRAVSARLRQLGGDRLAGKRLFADHLRRQRLQPRLLFRRSLCVDAGVVRRPELRLERAVVLARVPARGRSDLRRQKIQDHAVLVGRPDGAVPAEEAGSGALLAAKTAGTVKE